MNAPSRRAFLTGGSAGVGTAALASLLGAQRGLAAPAKPHGGLHHAPRAKRVIYLFQSGAPSQLDLFDHKPGLVERQGEDLPASIRKGQRLTGMTATQERFPVAASKYRFAKHGDSGLELSELLPHTAKVADELCVVKSLHTTAINHDPAITFFQTGAQLAGRPSAGACLVPGVKPRTPPGHTLPQARCQGPRQALAEASVVVHGFDVDELAIHLPGPGPNHNNCFSVVEKAKLEIV